MNMNLNDAVSGLLQLGADGMGVTINLTIQHVEHLTLALPELMESLPAVNAAPEKLPKVRKRTAPKPKNHGRWEHVKDRDHVKRAAKFIAVRELDMDRTDYLQIDDELAYDVYEQHQDLATAASKANHKLRQKRVKGIDISRASYWDAAFVDAVLDGLTSLPQAIEFANEWSRGSWTLGDVGATRHDFASTIRAFNNALNLWLRRSQGQFV
jgi:hypothetical protein